MADTLNFGPEWLRALSNGTSLASPPPSPSIQQFKLADYRYGREEMLGLLPKSTQLMTELDEFSALSHPENLTPLSLIHMSEEECTASQSVNSSVVLRMMGRGGGSVGPGAANRGRGTNSRGRGGGSLSSSTGRPRTDTDRKYEPHEQDDDFFNSRQRSNYRTQSWDDNSGDPPNRSALDKSYPGYQQPRRQTSESQTSESWRSYSSAGRSVEDSVDNWRTGSRNPESRDRWRHPSGGGGGGGSKWRGGDRERPEWSQGYDGPEEERHRSASGNGGDSVQKPDPDDPDRLRRHSSNSPWDDPVRGVHLPEWSTDDIDNPENLGTFDSGKFIPKDYIGGHVDRYSNCKLTRQKSDPEYSVYTCHGSMNERSMSEDDSRLNHTVQPSATYSQQTKNTQDQPTNINNTSHRGAITMETESGPIFPVVRSHDMGLQTNLPSGDVDESNISSYPPHSRTVHTNNSVASTCNTTVTAADIIISPSVGFGNDDSSENCRRPRSNLTVRRMMNEPSVKSMLFENNNTPIGVSHLNTDPTGQPINTVDTNIANPCFANLRKTFASLQQGQQQQNMYPGNHPASGGGLSLLGVANRDNTMMNYSTTDTSIKSQNKSLDVDDHFNLIARAAVNVVSDDDDMRHLPPPPPPPSVSGGSVSPPSTQVWFYKDPQGDVQGPFTCAEMGEWFCAGYFTMSLLVKGSNDEHFRLLGDVIKSWGRFPFQAAPHTSSDQACTLVDKKPVQNQKQSNNTMLSDHMDTPATTTEQLLQQQQQLIQEQVLHRQLMLQRDALMRQAQLAHPPSPTVPAVNSNQHLPSPDTVGLFQQLNLMQGIMSDSPNTPTTAVNSASANTCTVNEGRWRTTKNNNNNSGNAWSIGKNSSAGNPSIWDVNTNTTAAAHNEQQNSKRTIEAQKKLDHEVNQHKQLELQRQQQQQQDEKKKRIEIEEIRRREQELQWREQELKRQQEQQQRQEEELRKQEIRLQEEREKQQEDAARRNSEKKEKRIQLQRQEMERIRAIEEERIRLLSEEQERKNQNEVLQQKKEAERKAFEQTLYDDLRHQEEQTLMRERLNEFQQERELQQQLKDREQQQQQLMESAIETTSQSKTHTDTTSPWGYINPPITTTTDTQQQPQQPIIIPKPTSLTEIQDMQAETEREERIQEEHQAKVLAEQEAMMRAIKMNAKQQTWSSAVTGSGAKSLIEIQREEEARANNEQHAQKQMKEQQLQQQLPPMQATSVWGGSAWSNTTNRLSHSAVWKPQSPGKTHPHPTPPAPTPVTSEGFWEDCGREVVSQQKNTNTNHSQLNTHKHSQKKDKPTSTTTTTTTTTTVADTNNGQHNSQHKSTKNKSKKEEETIRKLFQNNTSVSNTFLKWSENSLQPFNSSIDIPTFVHFLLEVESASEIHDYVRSYLGESKEASQFAKKFIEKRTQEKHRQNQNAGKTKGRELTEQQSTSQNHQQQQPTPPADEDTSKSAKKRKKKMQKVDPSILGFSCASPPDRVSGVDVEDKS